jgi:hypothetical protein
MIANVWDALGSRPAGSALTTHQQACPWGYQSRGLGEALSRSTPVVVEFGLLPQRNTYLQI